MNIDKGLVNRHQNPIFIIGNGNVANVVIITLENGPFENHQSGHSISENHTVGDL